MQTNNNVSFKASRVSVVNLPQKVNNAKKQIEATFVKLNPYNKEDIATLQGIEKLWQNQNLSGAIRESATIANAPIYGLTTQTENLKSLDPKKILGLFSTDKIDKTTDIVEIYQLGTTPEHAYAQKTRSREIKHIGSTMIKEFVKVLNLNKHKNVEKLVIGSEPESVKFYKRINMTEKPGAIDVFELPREKFTEFIG